jgi:hypothetical protein
MGMQRLGSGPLGGPGEGRPSADGSNLESLLQAVQVVCEDEQAEAGPGSADLMDGDDKHGRQHGGLAYLGGPQHAQRGPYPGAHPGQVHLAGVAARGPSRSPAYRHNGASNGVFGPHQGVRSPGWRGSRGGPMAGPSGQQHQQAGGGYRNAGLPAGPNGHWQPQLRLEDLLGITLAPCSVPLFHNGSVHTGSPGGGGNGFRPHVQQLLQQRATMSAPDMLTQGAAAQRQLAQDPRRALVGDHVPGLHPGLVSNGVGAGPLAKQPGMGGGNGKHLSSGDVNAMMMGVLLGSPILASMPAATMSTVQLFRAVKS